MKKIAVKLIRTKLWTFTQHLAWGLCVHIWVHHQSSHHYLLYFHFQLAGWMFPTHTCKDNCIKKVLDQSRQLLFQTDKEHTDHAVLRLIHLRSDQHLISPYINAAGSFIKIMRMKKVIANLRGFDCYMNSPFQYQRTRVEKSIENMESVVMVKNPCMISRGVTKKAHSLIN